MRGKLPNADWNSIHTKANQVLGEDFWQDISEMIPVLGPRIDVYETDKEVAVYVELPGQPSAEHIRVSLNGSVLTIRGDIPATYSDHGAQFHVSERFFGSFSRKITLPNIVYRDIRAKFNHGVLFIHLIKTEQAVERTIDIEQE